MRARSIAVGACGTSAFIDMYATQPLLPELRHVFGVGEAEIGFTITAVTIAVALISPFIGPLADRLGRKRVIVASILALALATLGTATATSLAALIAWRFVQGACMPGIFTVIVAYVSEEFPPAVAGRAFGTLMTGNVIGGFSGRYLSALVAAHSSWQTVFVVLGILNVAGAALVWRLLPTETAFVRGAPASTLHVMGRFLRNPELLATYALGGSVLFTLMSAFTFVTYYLAEAPFLLSTVAIGNIFFVYLFGLISAPAGGRLVDRFGSRTTMLLAIGVSSAGLLLTLVPSVTFVIVGLGIMASSVFVAQACSQGYIGRVVSENRSTAVSLYFTAYYLAGGLGAFVPAWAWAWGRWPATVGLIVAVQLVCGALTFFGWRARTLPVAVAPTVG